MTDFAEGRKVHQVSGPVDELDGRRRRSIASRQKIIDAMVKLVKEGDLKPSAEMVALKAGVGRRTVFRIFSDMEGIFLEIQSRFRTNLAPLRAIPLKGDTLEEKLHSLVVRRVMLFEEITMLMASAKLYRYDSPALQQGNAAIQRELRMNLLNILDDDLRNDIALCEALDAALSIEMWQRLRIEQKLDAQMAASVFHRLAQALTKN